MSLKIKEVLLALVLPAVFLLILNQAHADSVAKRKRAITTSATKKLVLEFPSSSMDIVGKFIHESYLKNNNLGLERMEVAPPRRFKTKKGKLRKIQIDIFETIDTKKHKAFVITVDNKKKVIKLKIKITTDQVKIERMDDDNRDLNTIQFRRRIKNKLLNILEDIEDYL